MLPQLLMTTLLAFTQAAPAPVEPDGSRTLGIVPPYRAAPTPPAWLRSTSHELAALDCKHYAYEAYTDAKGAWLVRYISFPDVDEAFREIEQVFLFTGDPKKKPLELKPADLRFEPKSAILAGKTFLLVDRRDLLKP